MQSKRITFYESKTQRNQILAPNINGKQLNKTETYLSPSADFFALACINA